METAFLLPFFRLRNVREWVRLFEHFILLHSISFKSISMFRKEEQTLRSSCEKLLFYFFLFRRFFFSPLCAAISTSSSFIAIHSFCSGSQMRVVFSFQSVFVKRARISLVLCVTMSTTWAQATTHIRHQQHQQPQRWRRHEQFFFLHLLSIQCVRCVCAFW